MPTRTRRPGTGNPLTRLLRSLKLAVLGPRRPSEVVRDAFMTGAEEIDPAHADPRAVVPEELPALEPGARPRRAQEGHPAEPHRERSAFDERHIPRDD